MRRYKLATALVILAMTSTALAEDDKPDEALVGRLLKDPKALADALAHCDPKAASMDRECLAAQEARKRQFFDAGTVPYTPQTVDPFPNAPGVQPFNRPPRQ